MAGSDQEGFEGIVEKEMKIKIKVKINKGCGHGAKTILLQKKFFKRIINVAKLHDGTINGTSDRIFDCLMPDFIMFRNVKWTKDFFTEDFNLYPVSIIYQKQKYEGFVYKASRSPHFIDRHHVEILAPKIKNLKMNTTLLLTFESR